MTLNPILCRFYKIEPEKTLIIHDEMDMEFGAIKFAENGGAGGHNGIRSIYSSVGKDLWRLRIGIGRPPPNMDPSDHVLQNFPSEQEPYLEEIIQTAISAIESFVQDGVKKAMNQFNRKRLDKEGD